MKITIKIMRALLIAVREDLARPHPWAHERVGFLIATAAEQSGNLLVTICDYQGVADTDYERSDAVGAQIGPNAMRKATQAAYRPARSLWHVHTHGGSGTPGFSGVDLRSATEFVPGFLHPIPKMPHGLLVLSDDSAAGLCWTRKDSRPVSASNFISVGAPFSRDWGFYELA
jgi:hypothetical protein